MKTIIGNKKSSYGRTAAGLIIIFIGAILLVDQLNLLVVPQWLFSWPMWLIGIGAYLAARYNFRKPVYGILIVLGLLLLVTNNVYMADKFIWPLAITGTGLWLVFRNRHKQVFI